MENGSATRELLGTIRSALGVHFSAFKTGDAPVSVHGAADYVRKTLDTCSISDRELSDIIASYAIDTGYNLHFDGGDKPADG